ncbi:MAG: hypothetical protein INR71_03315, partial [Terriglobus roseus]|nr:hypothetical protein [Terriglobus roseus]
MSAAAPDTAIPSSDADLPPLPSETDDSLAHHPDDDDSLARHPDYDDSVAVERDMQRRLMDIESSFVPADP